MFWQIWNEDLIFTISQYLDTADLVALTRVNKRLSEIVIERVLSKFLYISDSNLQTVLVNAIKRPFKDVDYLTVTGDFNKQERSDLCRVWNQISPHYFVLDSNIADFPSFYKCKSLFNRLQVIEAHNGSFEYIEVDEFVKLDKVVIITHDNHDAHLRIKDFPNITTLCLKDCLFVPHSELSDYIFGGRRAPRPVDVAKSRAMPYLTKLISHNAQVKQETMALNSSLMNNAPLWIPNIVELDLKDDHNPSTDFSYIKGFKHLKVYKYHSKSIEAFETFPLQSTIEILKLSSPKIVLTNNFDALTINTISINASHTLVYDSTDFPKCSKLQLRYKNNQICQLSKQWYYKHKLWMTASKMDCFEFLLSLK